MKAMILAAGLGTRLKPITDKIPKALTSLYGKPLIEFIIRRLIQCGVNEIIINVHHHAQQIIDFVKSQNDFNIRIEFSHESVLLDTGGGLKKASWFFSDKHPFILHNVDVLSDINFHKMISFHKTNKASVTLAVRSRKTSRFLLFDENDRFLGWKNKETVKTIGNKSKILNPFSFMGIHIISPGIFSHMPEMNTFSIIDLYLRITQMEHIIQAFHADQYFWFDLGKLKNIKEATQYLARIKYKI
jgi:mannose-1-phosphate guanylyltransferase